MSVTLGIQSYCFREFKDNAKTAGLVKDLGLSAIELCNVHVDFHDGASYAKAIATYGEKGVAIVSIGVNRITGREKEDRDLFEFVKACGARIMSVDFGLENLDQALAAAERLSEEYGVKLGIHNHGGRHWLGSMEALSYVFGRTSPRIGLCLDTAWALDAREDPVAMVEKFRGRLTALHLKDFVFDRAGRPEDVVVGTGNLKLKALDSKLKERGFSGNAILEYEKNPENPVPALKKCVAAIRNELTILSA